jgi:L-ascorbate metabolism protein UlaG (beta-lactamase superfamily)
MVRLQWLGVSSWILAGGDDVVVIDPFFSRPSLPAIALSMALPRLAPPIVHDAARIRGVLPDLPARTRLVLITHAHYDHLLDVPYYVARAGARVRYGGSATALNLLRAFPGAPDETWEAKDGASTRAGNVRVTAFATDHAPQLLGLCLMSGEVTHPPARPPRTAGEYLGGQNFSYLVDFLEGDAVTGRVFVNGSASSHAGGESLRAHREIVEQRRVDVAILCVPGWNHVDDYPDSVLEALRPDVVVTSHFDNFFRPYRSGEDPQAGMPFIPLARYAQFVGALQRLRAERGYAYEIWQPATGQCLRVPASPGAPPCDLRR